MCCGLSAPCQALQVAVRLCRQDAKQGRVLPWILPFAWFLDVDVIRVKGELPKQSKASACCFQSSVCCVHVICDMQPWTSSGFVTLREPVQMLGLSLPSQASPNSILGYQQSELLSLSVLISCIFFHLACTE